MEGALKYSVRNQWVAPVKSAMHTAYSAGGLVQLYCIINTAKCMKSGLRHHFIRHTMTCHRFLNSFRPTGVKSREIMRWYLNTISEVREFSSCTRRCSLHMPNSTKQNPSWEATSFSTNQKIPTILLNPKVHYLIHKTLPVVPNPSPVLPIHGTFQSIRLI